MRFGYWRTRRCFIKAIGLDGARIGFIIYDYLLYIDVVDRTDITLVSIDGIITGVVDIQVLDIDSTANGKTTFTVTLPRSPRIPS